MSHDKLSIKDVGRISILADLFKTGQGRCIIRAQAALDDLDECGLDPSSNFSRPA